MVNPGYKQTEIGILPTSWELALLTDKCELLNGLTYTPDNVQDNGLLVLRSSNIQNSQINLGDTVFVNCMVDKEKYVKKDDILICVRNGSAALIGKCAKADRDYYATFGAFMAVLRGQNNDFIFQLLQQGNIQKHINKNSDSTINQITNADFKSIVIPWPSEADERETIATALSDIDALITNLEKLIAKKEAIKQGAMQELLTGKRRLPGFVKTWDEYLLGNIVRLINGRAYAQEELLDSGKYPVLRLGNLFTNEHWYYSNLELPEKQYCVRGDLIYAWSATFGPRVWKGEKSIFHYHIWKLQLADIVDRDFLYHYLCYDVNVLMSELQGGTMAHLTKATMEKRTVIIPQIDEQIAIAKILSDMDADIEEYCKELKKYRKIKSGMMSELLTGRIRLV